MNHRPVADVLAANLSLDDGPSAAAIVFAAGVAVAPSRCGRVASAPVRRRLADVSRSGRRPVAPGT